jgi:hypothetical protein
MANVNIKDLDKAEVLLALWKGSHAQGMSFLGMMGGGLTLEKAKEEVNELKENNHPLYFDYVMGHVIKCDITGDEFDPRLYDRDCGEGRAAEVIEALRNGTPIEDEMTEDNDFMRCFIDLVTADEDAKRKGDK